MIHLTRCPGLGNSHGYTPGPWRAERDTIVQGLPCWRIESDSVRTLACLTFSSNADADGYGKANAQLIAAAPRMLDALKIASAYIMRAMPPGAHIALDRLSEAIREAEAPPHA